MFSHTVGAVLLLLTIFVVRFERFFGIFTFTMRIACFSKVFFKKQNENVAQMQCSLAALILHDLTDVEKPCFSHTVDAVLLFPSYFVVVFERFFGIFTFT